MKFHQKDLLILMALSFSLGVHAGSRKQATYEEIEDALVDVPGLVIENSAYDNSYYSVCSSRPFVEKLKCQAEYALSSFPDKRMHATPIDVNNLRKDADSCFKEQQYEVLTAINEVKKNIDFDDEKFTKLEVRFQHISEDINHELGDAFIKGPNNFINAMDCDGRKTCVEAVYVFDSNRCYPVPASKIISILKTNGRQRSPETQTRNSNMTVDPYVEKLFFKTGANPINSGEKYNLNEGDYLSEGLARFYIDTFSIQSDGDYFYINNKKSVLLLQRGGEHCSFESRNKNYLFYQDLTKSAFEPSKLGVDLAQGTLLCSVEHDRDITFEDVRRILPQAVFAKGLKKGSIYIGLTEDGKRAIFRIGSKDKIVPVEDLMFPHMKNEAVETEQIVYSKSLNAFVFVIAMNKEAAKIYYRDNFTDIELSDLIKFDTSEIPVNEQVYYRLEDGQTKAYVKGQATIEGVKKFLILKEKELLFADRSELTRIK